MTTVATIEVECPECGSLQEFTRYDAVNVTLNPEKKQKILNGNLVQFNCPSCGYQVESLYPMLYHDQDKKFMVWIDPDGKLDIGQFDEWNSLTNLLDHSYRYRIVSNRNQLIEKILIFDDGLDDRVVEFMKIVLKDRILKQEDPAGTAIMYGGLIRNENDEPEVVIIKQKLHEHESFSISFDASKKSEALCLDILSGSAEKGTGPWLRVNEDYFKKVLQIPKYFYRQG